MLHDSRLSIKSDRNLCEYDGLDHKDDEVWTLLKNSDSDEYKAGMYMCKCLIGILYYNMNDHLDVAIISLEMFSRDESADSTPRTSTPIPPVQQSIIPIIQPAISSLPLDIEENSYSESTPLKWKLK